MTRIPARKERFAVVPPLIPLLRERRSTQQFDTRHELDASDVAALMEAARWAPSAGNSQPWAFLLGRRGSTAHRMIVECLAPSTRRWAPDASALLVALHRTAADATDVSLTYSDYAMYDLGQAVAHVTIQAASMGLSTHQFAAFDHDGVASAAGVPAHWEVTTGIAVGLGRPTAGPERTRLDTSKFVFGEVFGGAWNDGPGS